MGNSLKLYKPDTTVIFDHRGVFKHVYHACKDPDGEFSITRDKVVSTAKYAFAKYIERYLEPILAEYAPRQLIICHDMGKVYRTRLFEGYKVKPESTKTCEIENEFTEELHKLLTEMFKRAGILQVGATGVEADDVIAHLCKNLKGLKLVYTVDADLLALVDPDTIVYLKEVPYTDEDVYNDLELGENNCISISKALMGDTSDRYGGVPGFGPAKWAELVDAFGLDGVKEIELAIETNNPQPLIDAAADTPLKSLQLILDNWDHFRLQWSIAKLHPELCWKPQGKTMPVMNWIRRVADPVALEEMLTKLNCKDLYHAVFEPHMPVSYLLDSTTVNPQFISDIKNEMLKSPFISFDYEGWDKEQHECYRENKPDFVDVLSQIVTGGVFTFGANCESSVYVTIGHKGDTNVPKEVMLDLLMFAYENKPLVVHNALYEIPVTETNFGVTIAGIYDTMIMASYWNENSRAGLKFLSKSLLNYDQMSYADTLAKHDAANMAELTPEQVFGYGVDDGVVTAALFDLFHMQMQLEGSEAFYETNELYTANVLTQGFVKGCKVDTAALAAIHAKDAGLVVDNMVTLREILEEHCSDSPELSYEGVENYIAVERPAQRKIALDRLKAKAKAENMEDSAGWVRRQLESTLTRWEMNLRASVIYVPLVEEFIPPAFVPTVTKLNAVTQQIGLPAIEKDSQTYISEWLLNATMTEEGERVEMSDEAATFCKLLGGAAKLLKRREGASYDEFKAFCTPYFEGKTVTSGDELSLNSPNQMQTLLYCKLGLPVRLHTKPQRGSSRDKLNLAGSPGTDDKVIKMALANDCDGENEWKREALNLLLQTKSSITRIGLYHTKYPNWLSPADGKLHPSIRNCGTVTRRPSASEPNVLQVSKGDMRTIFIPPHQDYVAVPIDFSGQELRIMACQTLDKNLLSVYGVEEVDGKLVHFFDKEKDLHGMTASGILGVPYEEFIEAYTDEHHERNKMYSAVRGKKAKGTNFGLSYGAGAETLSRNLTVPVQEAKELLDAAHAKYSGIKLWQESSAKFAKTYGYTETSFGTRRHMTADLFSKDPSMRARNERQGANFEIQGTAADMLKKCLSDMWKTGVLSRLRVVFFAPIYDEIVAWVHVDDVWQYCQEMQVIMAGSTPPGHIVPQVPEFSIGSDWGTLKELGRLPAQAVVEAAAKAAWERNQERLHLWTDVEEAA